ncbi:MAG TPA: class I SAM-dependent methyltransferase [Micromonosporaceae bacterium]
MADIVSVLQRRYRNYFADRAPVVFAITDVDGEKHVFGADGHDVAPAFTITVNDAAGAKALASMDQLQVAVGYLRGHLDLDGDMMTVLAMRKFFPDFHPIAWLARFAPALLRGSTEHDRRSISAHYERESDFFLTFMDKRHRCYTQGVFQADDELLEDAMTRKMDLAIEAIGAKPGDHVLEVGGGWGAFMEHAGRRGIRVTSLTLVEESERYLNQVIDAHQLPATVVREHLLQYRAPQRYDAIVNMGVTEHLPDYKATLRKYAELVKPGGRVYLDALAMRAKHRLSTFMSRYIYPGESSPLLLHAYLRQVARSPFELISVDDDRHNYFLTCQEWARRLDAARDEVQRRWGDQLYRRFRIFLWGSAAAFDTGLVQAYRWVLRMPEARPA